MISRKDFVETLQAIQSERQRREDAQKQLQKLGLSIDWNEAPFLQPLLNLLKAATPDPYDYISWWLYEDVEHDISWKEDGKEVSVNVNDPNDLYDFLMANHGIGQEDLPLFDLPAADEATFPIPEKGIEEVDFTNHMDRVLEYLDQHEEVIHIMQEGKKKYVLLSTALYEKLFAPLNIDPPAEAKGKVTVGIEVDAELAEQARAVLAEAGFTLEQAAEMFLTWCAHYPEDATAWLKKAMEEQGIGPQAEEEQT